MSGKYNGFATNSQEKSPKAIKSGPLQQLLGARIIFYVRFNEATFSLLSRRLEQAVATVRERRKAQGTHHYNINNFCETRWVETITKLQDFEDMYEALLICLDAMGCV